MNKDTQKEEWPWYQRAPFWELGLDEQYDVYDMPAVIAESKRRTLAEVKEMVEEVQKQSDHMWSGDSVPFHHACSTILDRINEMMEK